MPSFWLLCGARARKHPIILLLVGFFVSVLGILLIELAKDHGDTLALLCNKLPKIMAGECGLDKIVGGMTGKFLELSFVALGVGLMGLAFDIKTKDDLDSRRTKSFEKLKSITKKEVQYQQNYDQLGNDLDSLSSAEKVRRFNNLRDVMIDILDERMLAEEELGKWL